MACLQVIYPDGNITTEVLSEREPITIGRHSSNTIVVDGADVPMLLARILWNKKSGGYEITAAAAEDLILSGRAVRSAVLQPGDLLQVRQVAIIYRPEVPLPNEEMVTKDFREPPRDPEFEQAMLAEPDPKPEPELEQPPPKTPSPPAPAELPRSVSKKKTRSSKKTASPEVTFSPVPPGQAEDAESIGQWLTQARRPGERDPLRSPLVTSLTFLGICLLITIGAVLLLISRQSAQADFAAAQADRAAGKYPQAITRYEQFLNEYPSSTLAEQARSELSLAYIDAALVGAQVDYQAALRAVEDFIEQHRQQQDYRKWYPELTRYTFQIATSAYRQASRRHDPTLLEAGDAARLLFARFKATDGSDDKQQQTIEKSSQQARADLLEFDVKKQTLALMDQQLQQQAISAALSTYRLAVVRYPQFARQPEFVSRLKQGLQLEQAQVLPSPQKEAAAPRPAEQPSLQTDSVQETYLIERRNSRLDIQSDRQLIWLLSDGCCLAFDRLTGQPQWKLTLGTVVPFEPIPVTVRFPCWLLPAESGQAVTLVKRETGERVWQTTLPAPCAVSPTVTESLAYIVTTDQRLLALELETGQIVSSMTFPRPLTAPVSLRGEKELLVVGEQDVFYLIDRAGWTCQSVRYTGHAPGTITAAPLPLSQNLLVVENDQPRSSRLCLFSLQASDWELTLSHSERLPGLAVNSPVLWGDRLFLETYGARITVWQLSDQSGELPFKRLTVAPLPFSEQTRLFLAPVEGDRLLVAGETLRDLTLLTNSFEQKELSVALGQTTQSLQTFGTNLILAGRSAPRTGDSLIHFNFDQKESYWRNQLSADPLLLLADPEQPENLRCLDANGKLFPLSRSQTQPTIRWTETIEPLFETSSRATTESTRVGAVSAATVHVVHQGNQVHLLNNQGKSQQKLTLAGQPELPPQLAGEAILWPDQQGVHLTKLPTASAETVASWTFPVSASPEQRQPVEWNDLVALEAGSFLGLYDRQTLQRWRVQENPGRYLAAAGSLELPEKVVGSGVLAGEIYYLVTKQGTLLAIDTNSLGIRSKTALPQAATAGPWLVDSILLIELAGETLLALDPLTPQAPVWSFSLEGSALAVAPLQTSDGQLICGLKDGRLLILDAGSGMLITTLQLAAPLSCAPLTINQTLYCGLTNGTVVKLLTQSKAP